MFSEVSKNFENFCGILHCNKEQIPNHEKQYEKSSLMFTTTDKMSEETEKESI